MTELYVSLTLLILLVTIGYFIYRWVCKKDTKYLAVQKAIQDSEIKTENRKPEITQKELSYKSLYNPRDDEYGRLPRLKR